LAPLLGLLPVVLAVITGAVSAAYVGTALVIIASPNACWSG
jgi:hypothetical protein